MTSKSVREEILESVALWLNETSTDRPFTDLHDSEGDGGFPGIEFMARPVVGAHFAFLTLGKACGGKASEGLAFLEEDSGFGSIDLKVQEAVLALGGSAGEL